MITQDKYGAVVNGDDTYADITDILNSSHGQIVFNWTDGEMTQLDILMSYLPPQIGNLQRGMKASTDLFVSVSGCGMFGFALNGTWKSPKYVGEKLGLGEDNDTTKALAELINGICERLI